MSRGQPTISDAIDRAPVRLVDRGWVGVLFHVDLRHERAKVRLASGTVLTRPLCMVEVIEPEKE